VLAPRGFTGLCLIENRHHPRTLLMGRINIADSVINKSLGLVISATY
jgi:hypothetical protein